MARNRRTTGTLGTVVCLALAAVASCRWLRPDAGLMLAQSPDEATRLVREYVRIDTSNPPGDTR